MDGTRLCASSLPAAMLTTQLTHIPGLPPRCYLPALGCHLQPFVPLQEDDTLATVLAQLAGSVRRVPVISPDGLTITNILSQSAVMQALLGMQLPEVPAAKRRLQTTFSPTLFFMFLFPFATATACSTFNSLVPLNGVY